ncbi:hypothetical protein AGMMS50293_03650 [Spirochaetia bacterium]|nr:hypothetical protein AGMMS50293_03650 [Spirochaetia bacterium]
MKQIENISENKNYSAVNIGDLNKIMEHSFKHPKSGQDVKGKVFIKEATKSTGTEISFTVLEPRTEIPFFHIHYKDEETYIILKGSGFFQVDDDCFPVTEGSIIRVAPQGKRGMCNASDNYLVYICIQSMENSLEQYYTTDGEKVPCEAKWKK